jgi:hypothetical protein
MCRSRPSRPIWFSQASSSPALDSCRRTRGIWHCAVSWQGPLRFHVLHPVAGRWGDEGWQGQSNVIAHGPGGHTGLPLQPEGQRVRRLQPSVQGRPAHVVLAACALVCAKRIMPGLWPVGPSGVASSCRSPVAGHSLTSEGTGVSPGCRYLWAICTMRQEPYNGVDALVAPTRWSCLREPSVVTCLMTCVHSMGEPE